MTQQTRAFQAAQPTEKIDPTLDQPLSLPAADLTGDSPSVPTAPPEYNPSLPRTFGRYQLLEVLGQGGMGVVYKAKQTGLERIVALKMILAGPGASEHAIARFHREAQSASSLDHPNIVPIYDFGDQHGQHYFTMAFIEGQTLHKLVEKGGPPATSETIRILLALASGMGYAHRKGLIHRDLKPDNVLIDREGQPRVLDFGLARLVEGDRLTASGQILGTPAYMSPEQARGESNLGPASDIYSLGAVLYFLLTGKRPFEGESALQTLIRVAHEIPVPPRAINMQVSTALDAICMRCLEKDPDRRFATAEALAEALKQAEGNPALLPAVPTRPDAPRATVVDKPVVPPSRRWLGVVAASALVIFLAGAGVFLATRDKPQETQQASTLTQPVVPDDPNLPKNLLSEFGLKVEFLGGKQTKDGPTELPAGAEIQLRVTVDRDAYVAIWTYGESGSVMQLFPNEVEQDNLIKAGEPRTIPGTEDTALKLTAARRPEHLRVIAATTKWEAMKGNKEGVWLVFRGEQRGELERDILLVRKKKPEDKEPPKVSEAVVPYWVR